MGVVKTSPAAPVATSCNCSTAVRSGVSSAPGEGWYFHPPDEPAAPPLPTGESTRLRLRAPTSIRRARPARRSRLPRSPSLTPPPAGAATASALDDGSPTAAEERPPPPPSPLSPPPLPSPNPLGGGPSWPDLPGNEAFAAPPSIATAGVPAVVVVAAAAASAVAADAAAAAAAAAATSDDDGEPRAGVE